MVQQNLLTIAASETTSLLQPAGHRSSWLGLEVTTIAVLAWLALCCGLHALYITLEALIRPELNLVPEVNKDKSLNKACHVQTSPPDQD